MPNDLSAFWMPFTANRQFKAAPRLLVEAKDMHYTTQDGRKVLDGTAGLWCVNAGHCREPIVRAVQEQVARMEYAPPFQMGHPAPFELAARLARMAPGDLDHVFFTNSGSESVDTALKIALAYHRMKGEGQRTRLIGRSRGYHGVGFGGISVGGMSPNRKFYGGMLGGVDHLPHTHSLQNMAFSRGQPEWGAHLADELEEIVALHDASTIAAVIVEPVAGSAGVLVPPKGYLERLRAICDKHGLLLIFDEVITGFGRLGTSFAGDRFGVVPDLMTTAKGLTNATVPMGAVFCRKFIHDAFMQGDNTHAVELTHGYTYSAHPLAAAAGLATLDVYQEEGLFERAAELEPYWQDALHSLDDAGPVVDVRNFGIMGAVQFDPRKDSPGTRGYDIFTKCYEKGVLVRYTADILAMSPPLIVSKGQIDQIVDTLAESIKEAA
ncbi:MAG: aspartate aminotransferase family protein [Rhodospirillaceae bacterium]|nr:aspartate aminotransferase family protein [Rhodospirillaceae bacterium]MBT6117945.1 aspartate aminotransferase family protein [Rhodospirillaceae bacterium]